MSRNEISARQFRSEADCINDMRAVLAPFAASREAIMQQAVSWVEQLRDGGMGLSVEAFLQEYSLSSREGVAIMCMAEALLRIPDAATANALLESTFADTAWESHLGASDSVYINASSWGLLLTGKILNFDAQSMELPPNLLRRLAKQSSEPVLRQALRAAMHLIAGQFVMGETIERAIRKGEKLASHGYRFSYDMLGEGARNQQQADAYFASYRQAIAEVASHQTGNADLFSRASVSIKLTALHPRYEWLQREAVMRELLPRLKLLVKEAQQAGIAVAIDAEEASRLDLELDVFEALRMDEDFAGYDGIGFVLQAYQKRAWAVLDYLLDLSRRSGQRIPVRLVKGAYWDSEVKAAQILGLSDYPVFTSKRYSDVSYLACAVRLLDHPAHFYPQFATHNAHTIAAIQHYGAGKQFEFQRLYGMGEKLYAPIVKTTPCRIYAPVGEHRDLLAYLIRRLLENGANSSFVHRALDKALTPAEVIEDPIAKIDEPPKYTLPRPLDIYPNRQNSTGFDYGNRSHMEMLEKALSSFAHTQWKAGEGAHGDLHAVCNPSHIAEQVGTAQWVTGEDIDRAAHKAQQAFASWSRRPVEERATILERAAGLLVSQRDELLALLMREAGKTLRDAVAEWREAIDFCRYYAQSARELMPAQTLPSYTGELNQLSLHGKGVFVCISPWNFPLAIFMGQVVAALVTGNAVLAKPAEQTPLVAAQAVALLHKAGIPHDVLHLLCGNGAVGAALVRHPLVAGVCFTGSHAVAKQIERALAAKDGAITPLIAETGGLNAMIADNSALPEQLCDDVVHSALGSAGQRCSALRLLFLPDGLADHVLTLITGAMQQLRIGNPWDFTTDIGSVIDAEAKTGLEAHISALRKDARLIAAAPLTDACHNGHFVAPQIWELPDASWLTREAFGPILHVVRYDPSQLHEVYDAVNASGYGLTFGLHTRIQSRIAGLAERIHSGNLYVNRGMTGAVVGVQPFGGEGLSGTGFKAGGPHYLLRFTHERATSINVAAIGGNIDLLMKN